LVYVLLIAFLTASRIPTFSGKKLGARVSREWVLPLFVLAVALVLLLIFYPWETLTALVLIYLGTIPLGVRHYRRLAWEYEASMQKAPAFEGPEPTAEPNP
jgi:CDP-diacylglycerol--serine O-phosphatidyltransferase